jgi:hypothetical protein
VEFHHTTIAFLYGNVVGVVNAGSLDGEPSVDEAAELAKTQLSRIEEKLSGEIPE